MTTTGHSQESGFGVIILKGGEKIWSNDSARQPQEGEMILRFTLDLPGGLGQTIPQDDLEELRREIRLITRLFADFDCKTHKIAKEVLQSIRRFDPKEVDDQTAYWTMQYLAAKARLVIKNVPEDNPDLRRQLNAAIQKLTNWARSTRIGFVEGLRLGEEKPWINLMFRAKEELQRIKERKSKILSPPHLNSRRMAKAHKEPEAVEYLGVPRLVTRLKSGKKILIIGGVPKPRKIELLRKHFVCEINVEWPNVAGTTVSRRLGPFEEQIQNGNVACVLLVNGIMSHQTANRIVLSCEMSQTPFRAVGTAGLESMKEALIKIDKALPA